MLRFECGKVSAQVIERAAEAASLAYKDYFENGASSHSKRSHADMPQNSTKRIKLESTNDDYIAIDSESAISIKVEFNFELDRPIEDQKILRSIAGMANSVVVNFTHRKALQYKWAKISILWLQDSLLEHEVAMPRRLQEHKEARAFWALAQGCNAFQIDASIEALQYTNSDCISATLKVVLKENCPDEIAYSLLQYAFLSPPAPLHYTLEQFYQHLQPPVLQHIASSYISTDLRPQLLPFQSQNVQWLVSLNWFVRTRSVKIHSINIINM
jgi:hypothetical protein